MLHHVDFWAYVPKTPAKFVGHSRQSSISFLGRGQYFDTVFDVRLKLKLK